MNTLTTLIPQFLQQHNLTTRPIVVALSGGLDSVCTLLLCHQYSKAQQKLLSAIHVNHGLSPNAAAWQESVVSLCQRLGISLQVCSVDLSGYKGSLEAEARATRYRVMAEKLPEHAVLVTGHHQADQFETVLMRLLRSSGLTGLAGMKAIADFPNRLGRAKGLTLARPLLNQNKSSLQQFVESSHITWLEDESNQSEQFDRNYIRHTITPLLTKRWPQALQAVSQSSLVLQGESALLAEYIQADVLTCSAKGFNDQPCLSIVQLQQKSVLKQQAIIRLFIREQSQLTPSRIVLNRIISELMPAKQDAQPVIELVNMQIRRHQGLIYLVEKSQIQNNISQDCQALSTEYELPVAVPYQSIRVQRLALEPELDLTLRYGQLNDSLKTKADSGSQQVKTILKQKGCPVWLRNKIPLIYHGEQLIAVANLQMDYRYKTRVKLSFR